MALKQKPIYVETMIRSSIEQLWERTQVPDLHEQWDLRFSQIRYLPRASEAEPQRFLYVTKIGFGLTIAGEGESVRTHYKETGERTSALKFWSDDPKSLIRKGSGYWRYIPKEEGVRFLTWYDYETRFGAVGRLVDTLVFRPLLGWATAWSFDCLRLWLEKGRSPTASVRLSLLYVGTVAALVTAWLYRIKRSAKMGALFDSALVNVAVMALAVIGITGARELPGARRCLMDTTIRS